VSSFDVEKVLQRAQEMLKNVQPTSTSTSQPYSSNVVVTSPTVANRFISLSASNEMSSETAKQSSKTVQQQQKCVQTRSNLKNSSPPLNALEDSKVEDNDKIVDYGKSSDEEQLKEENELLGIKINKLRYDLKLRDTTVEDLKVKYLN
jgi:hypothetical protein